jgi:hypothetical protein
MLSILPAAGSTDWAMDNKARKAERWPSQSEGSFSFSLWLCRPSPRSRARGYEFNMLRLFAAAGGAFSCPARDRSGTGSASYVHLKPVFKVFLKIFPSFHCFQAVDRAFFYHPPKKLLSLAM